MVARSSPFCASHSSIRPSLPPNTNRRASALKLLVLIGATTENPSFEVIPALLSRLRVFVLQEFSEDEMKQIIDRSGLRSRFSAPREFAAGNTVSDGSGGRLRTGSDLPLHRQ